MPSTFVTNHKLHIVLALLLASSLPVLMVAVRMVYTGYAMYTFLVWNLFLAWLPFTFALLAYQLRQRIWLVLPLSGLWLLFLPNAPYLITDLIHLRHSGHYAFFFCPYRVDVGFSVTLSDAVVGGTAFGPGFWLAVCPNDVGFKRAGGVYRPFPALEQLGHLHQSPYHLPKPAGS
jgi:hypothetical protein